MIASAALLFLSGVLANSHAAPHDHITALNLTDLSSVNGTHEHIEVKLDIEDFLENVEPFESGEIGDTVPIPELANLTLIRQNGSLIYDIPEEGLEISPELYERITGHPPKPWNKRDGNPCNSGTYRKYDLIDANWSKFFGYNRVMSSPLCGPGSISKTYSVTYSYSITGSVTATFGPAAGTSVFQSLGFTAGFSYTWGNAIATGYSATCDLAHPCIATFKPWIGLVKGRGRWTELSNQGNKLCRSGIGGNLELRLPIVRDCTGPDADKECGADGVWDQCYFVGTFAQGACSNLGPTPAAARQCPKEMYPA
ncbi:hypothetical protein BS50DRAFT_594525 [Corynespora cassiicola Philippines]|uniref:Uncharacterized protein n=1 Tax=Corynespora cassiicola Philippines TaxID=1448308 RepID=A0A2T2N2N2_CORCC|nr:hypothetical protein BS50DRAFT_594525 [Corynespora cassiicola Philippines]